MYEIYFNLICPHRQTCRALDDFLAFFQCYVKVDRNTFSLIFSFFSPTILETGSSSWQQEGSTVKANTNFCSRKVWLTPQICKLANSPGKTECEWPQLLYTLLFLPSHFKLRSVRETLVSDKGFYYLQLSKQQEQQHIWGTDPLRPSPPPHPPFLLSEAKELDDPCICSWIVWKEDTITTVHDYSL